MTGQPWRLIEVGDVANYREDIAAEVENFVGDRLDVHAFLGNLEQTLILEHGVELGNDMDSPAIKAVLRMARAIKRDYEAHS